MPEPLNVLIKETIKNSFEFYLPLGVSKAPDYNDAFKSLLLCNEESPVGIQMRELLIA